jgi:photosystem II stability/assembly factor-like uncharacterized protein
MGERPKEGGMSIRFNRSFKRTFRPTGGIFAGWASVAAVLLILAGSPILSFPDTAPTQAVGSPLVGKTWVRTGGPMGGRGYDIRMRPDNLDVMYVTDQFAGIHKSVDGGRTWFPINEGIDARAGSSGDAIPTFCLTIDPNNNDIIWAGTLGYRGIYRSSNGGQTWEKRTSGIVEDMDLTLRGFTIEPQNSDVVYAAGEVIVGPGEVTPNRAKGVVYKTTDGGANWQAVWRGDNVARYVWIDPTNHNTLYVSTGIFDREAANSNLASDDLGGVGILKSVDGGTTWKTINNGLKSLYVGSLFMHPSNPKILLAGAGAGFGKAELLSGSGAYITTDGGENWTKVITNALITSVEFSTTDPNVAYAAGGSFYRSGDGGWTWTLYSAQMGFWGPPGIRNGTPIDFQADPRNPLRLFANNYNGGNLLSLNGGQTWESATIGYSGAEVAGLTVHKKDSGLVYACDKGNPFLTANGGQEWRGINYCLPYPVPDSGKIVIDPSDSSHLLMAQKSDARAYESHDGGNTWEMTLDCRDELFQIRGHNMESVLAMAFAPAKPTRVYAGFGASRCGPLDPGLALGPAPIMSFLISEDGGHSWIRKTGTALDGKTVTDIVVHPTNSDIAWASTGGAGVFQTSDGGATWQSISNGLGSLVVAGLAMNPPDMIIIYAATVDSGVFKTEDGGGTWRRASAGMNPNEAVTCVVIDPIRPNVVYAGSQASGVFVSEDAGATWRLINTGLRTRAVRSMAISADGMILYVGTIGEGVFRLGDLAAPTMAEITPAVGATAGGTAVRISGSGFIAGGTSVTFGGTVGTSVNVESSASLTVVAPAHAAGTVAVSVTTAYGSGSLAGGFAYVVVPMINVTSPNGGETWTAGSTKNITWTSEGTAGNVKIEYSIDGGANYVTIIASTANSGIYPWTVPNTASANCVVRISDAGTGTPSDVSNAVFSIVTQYSISGLVTLASHAGAGVIQAGLAGVTLNGLPGNPATDASGAYTANVDHGWSGTVTATKAGYTFSPPSRTYTSVTSAQASQDYSATALRKDDFLGAWAGQGVYYRNSDTGGWVQLASPATMIAAGDLDGDGIDDLIGSWPTQGGVWVKYSQSGTWANLSSTADWIAAADMNGDGRDELLGTWTGQGVYWRNNTSGVWTQLATPATKITTGDLDGDGIDDLIGTWPTQGGVWVKYSQSGTWALLSSTADWIAAGDMNGDRRDDLIGAWTGQGVYYRDSLTGQWVMMASAAIMATTGDLDGDGTGDLIGIWPTQGGVWVKFSQSGIWALLSSTADWIATGKMRTANSQLFGHENELALPMGGMEVGPSRITGSKDFSANSPGRGNFAGIVEKNLTPEEPRISRMIASRIPSPGEPGFICRRQKNLIPGQGSSEGKKEIPKEKK